MSFSRSASPSGDNTCPCFSGDASAAAICMRGVDGNLNRVPLLHFQMYLITK
jgi:hypothetical protein